jgi:hypothetical protein
MNASNTIVSSQPFRQALGIPGAGRFESTASADPTFFDKLRPILVAHGETKVDEALDRIREAFQELTDAETSPGVLNTTQHQLASLLQSELAERGLMLNKGKPAPAGGFEVMFDTHDILGWVGSVFTMWRRLSPHQWLPPAEQIEAFGKELTIAVLGDWGTNLYGAPASAQSAAKTKGLGLLLHLGDVYYSGTDKETEGRFLEPWPQVRGVVSRALNGNHEMYAGGIAYFDRVLPKFGQQSSCFAWQNPHWLLIGLDTAYMDFDLDKDRQVPWLRQVVGQACDRGIVLFSHHQLFSLFESQGTKIQSAIGDLLARRRIFAWYWGHEHRCFLFDKHPTFGLFGRCVGHSGMPYFRDLKGDNRTAWHRHSATSKAPGGILLDGPNPYILNEEQKYGPNGYVTLQFTGADLTESVHLPDGKVVWTKKLTENNLVQMAPQ